MINYFFDLTWYKRIQSLFIHHGIHQFSYPLLILLIHLLVSLPIPHQLLSQMSAFTFSNSPTLTIFIGKLNLSLIFVAKIFLASFDGSNQCLPPTNTINMSKYPIWLIKLGLFMINFLRVWPLPPYLKKSYLWLLISIHLMRYGPINSPLLYRTIKKLWSFKSTSNSKAPSKVISLWLSSYTKPKPCRMN